MNCSVSLVMPGLCGPLPEHVRGLTLGPVDELAELLGQRSSNDSMGYLATLATLVGVDTLPVAGLSLLASDESHRSDYCMQVEPVHLKADIDHALMIDSTLIGVSHAERQQFRHELNAHFAEDDVTIIDDVVGNWYIASAEPFGITTTAVEEVIARNVNLFLPTGEQAMVWKRYMNESQMLLFQSALNAQREASGLMSVNSLWPMADSLRVADMAPATNTFDLILGDSTLHHGIANAIGSRYESIGEQVMSDLPQGRLMLCDTSMMRASASGDVQRWGDLLRERIDALLKPLVELARRSRLELTVFPCAGSRYTIGRRRLFDRLFRPDAGEVICYGH